MVPLRNLNQKLVHFFKIRCFLVQTPYKLSNRLIQSMRTVHDNIIFKHSDIHPNTHTFNVCNSNTHAEKPKGKSKLRPWNG